MKKQNRKEHKFKKILIVLIIILVLLVGAVGFLVWRNAAGQLNLKKSSDRSTSAESAGEFKMSYVGSDSSAQTSSETNDGQENAGSQQESVDTSPAAASDAPAADERLSARGVYSDNALMIRVKDNAVFFEKNSRQKVYPASMTKVMTALVALEHLNNLDEKVEIKQDAIDKYYKEGASRAGFEAGETVTVRDLFYGIMLPSGADACLTICSRVAGSEDKFVELMNQKAKELGMNQTHFTNAIGMQNKEHYTTCEDYVKLMKTAIGNENLRKMMSTRTYTTSATSVHPSGINLTNTCFVHISDAKLSNGAEILGGKTGYTKDALTTLASFATYKGDEYVMVTAHGGGTSHPNITDALTLYGRLGTDQIVKNDKKYEAEEKAKKEQEAKQKKESETQNASD